MSKHRTPVTGSGHCGSWCHQEKQTSALAHSVILKIQPSPRDLPRASDCHLTSRREQASVRPPGQSPPRGLGLAMALNGSAAGTCLAAHAAGLPAWPLQPRLAAALQAFPTTPALPSTSPAGRDAGAEDRGKRCVYTHRCACGHTHTHTLITARIRQKHLHEDSGETAGSNHTQEGGQDSWRPEMKSGLGSEGLTPQLWTVAQTLHPRKEGLPLDQLLVG